MKKLIKLAAAAIITATGVYIARRITKLNDLVKRTKDTREEILIIGDPHKEWETYVDFIAGYDKSICLGDLGLGILNKDKDIRKMLPEGEHYIIRGNHDNPEMCLEIPECLCTFGYINDGDIFYIAGSSIPPYIAPDEWGEKCELSTEDLDECLKLYEEVKPLIVVSHTCPSFISRDIHILDHFPGKTDLYMNKMFKVHKPNMWLFGHHHKSYEKEHDGCIFKGLRELETYKLKV
jgi:calcineurin-like phosphoesterase family protein